jgi:hypothetical protein
MRIQNMDTNTLMIENTPVHESFVETEEPNHTKGSNHTKEHFTSINMTNTKNVSLPLHEYFIKSSWNSAYNMNTNSIDKEWLKKNIIARGCRFLDFEIYNIQNIPEVGFSTQLSYLFTECSTTVDFDTIMRAVASSAFSEPCPNPQDPLLIHLRIKSTSPKIYSSIANSIKNNFNPGALVSGKINTNTRLQDFQNKVIIIVSKIQSPTNYSELANCTGIVEDCLDLNDFVNLESGTAEFPSTEDLKIINSNNKPLAIQETDGSLTNVSKLQMVYPNLGLSKTNPNSKYSDYVESNSIQICPMRFFMDDSNLANYEKLFMDNGKCAFVSMATVLSYMHQ